MKEILKAKLSFAHLSIVFIIALIGCAFLLMLGIPLIYWATFGEGASSDGIYEMPIHNVIMNWGAIIVISVLYLTLMTYSYNKLDFTRAKSYLITAIVIFVIFMFRIPIIEMFIGI